jgi:type IV pilus assembly protein PilA
MAKQGRGGHMSIRRIREDRGFSLIEMMVVVLIIAILVAIAIPAFLGARRRAQDTQAKSVLRAALVAEKTYLAEKQEYTSDTTELSKLENALAWGNDDAAVKGVVVEDISPNKFGVVLASVSRSRTRFCLADMSQDFNYPGYALSQGGTYYTKRENPPPDHCASLVWEVTSTGWG